MTTFHLIRHAEKESDPDALTARAPGVRLSAEGRRQAEWLARSFAEAPLRRVLSGPLERARETAEPLAATAGVTLEIAPALDEFDFGMWTGRHVSELAPDRWWRRFNTFRSATRIPGGETMLDVQARFVTEMLRIADAEPDGAVALVSHGDPIKAAVAYFACAPLDAWNRFEIAPASITTIVLDDHGAVITRLNHEPARER